MKEKEELARRLKVMHALLNKGIIRGVIYKKKIPCYRESCLLCKAKKFHGPFYYLTYRTKRDKKARTFYVPKSMIKRTKNMITNYQDIMSLINEVTNLNLSIIRKEGKRR